MLVDIREHRQESWAVRRESVAPHFAKVVAGLRQCFQETNLNEVFQNFRDGGIRSLAAVATDGAIRNCNFTVLCEAKQYRQDGAGRIIEDCPTPAPYPLLQRKSRYA